MDFSPSSLLAGFVFGVFGVYFFKQGKKEGHLPNLVIGLSLIVYPYFFENPFALWGIGAALLFLGFRMK